ncbi:MAG: hypothetical protein CFE45_02140 [Burkholderiales bacterium PBB5]|nr:MAG: hypothetical protein CFE45_02140 [Burkholderiales bacterium PBB5]
MSVQKRTFCRVCEPACGLVATVEGDRLVTLAADRTHPISQGFVCNKGLYGADLHNDPDRLKVPLKRVAPGRFEPVGWDEALADIAQRLRATLDQHGAGAVASYTGNPAAFNSLFGQAFGGFLVSVRPSHLDAGGQPQRVAVSGFQRCGSNSSTRLAGCVGSRSSTSLR